MSAKPHWAKGSKRWTPSVTQYIQASNFSGGGGGSDVDGSTIVVMLLMACSPTLSSLFPLPSSLFYFLPSWVINCVTYIFPQGSFEGQQLSGGNEECGGGVGPTKGIPQRLAHGRI